MTDFTTTNVHAKAGAGLEDTVVGLLFRTGSLKAEIRALEDDQRRLLTALGLDPDRDGIEAGIAAAEALVAFLTASEGAA